MPQFPFSFWKNSAVPQAMYFYDMGSTLFNDAANWFTDAGHTIPAGRTPINGDSLTLSSDFGDNAPPLTIELFAGMGPTSSALQTADLTITATGAVNISAGIWGGSNAFGATGYFSGTAIMGSSYFNSREWTGSCEFHDTAHNEGTVQLYGLFYDTSYNGGGGSVYVPYFYDSSTNQGGFADAWFYNNSYNGSGFGGNSGQFYDNSVNYGALSMGPNNFYDNAQNAYGATSAAISGQTYFYGYSTNDGYVQQANFYDNSQSLSMASYGGTVYFNNYSANYSAVSDGTYYDDSQDYGSTYFGNFYGHSVCNYLSGYGNFNDFAVNYGTNEYGATFNSSTTNFGTCNSTATFYSTSGNFGSIATTATFNDSSQNLHDIYASAYFYGTSSNGAGIYIFGPTIELHDSAVNYGITDYPATFYGSSANGSTGTVNNGFLGTSHFYDSSGNAGIAFGQTVFHNTTHNLSGGFAGQVELYDNAENDLGAICNLNAYFYNDTINYGGVNYDAYFFDNSNQLGTVNILGGTTTCSTTGTCP